MVAVAVTVMSGSNAPIIGTSVRVTWLTVTDTVSISIRVATISGRSATARSAAPCADTAESEATAAARAASRAASCTAN